MTVSELIEELQRLPGDCDLRPVLFYVTLHRGKYFNDTRVDCAVSSIGIEHDAVAIRAFGHIDY